MSGSDEPRKSRDRKAVQADTPPEHVPPRNPAGTPGRGVTSAPDVAAPRQKEAVKEGQTTVRGFTGTGVTGSTGGRKTHGQPLEEEEEER